MKHLLLTIALAIFSLNSFASSKCLISFEDVGSHDIDNKEITKVLTKKNYKAASMYDIKGGDLLASLTRFGHDEELSTDDSQVITFTQIIQKLIPYAGDFRLEIIHTKTVSIDIPNEEFIKLNEKNIPAFAAKIRVQNLPSCKTN